MSRYGVVTVRRVYAVRSLAIYTLKPYHPPLQRRPSKRETKSKRCCVASPVKRLSSATHRAYTNLTQCAAWTRPSSRWQALTISPRLNTPLATESTGVRRAQGYGEEDAWRAGGYGNGATGSTTQATAYRRGGARGGLHDAGAYGTQYEGYGGGPRAYDSERSTSTSMARCNLRLFCLRINGEKYIID